MNKREVMINISKTIIVIFLPLAILLTILQYYSYNKDFYMQKFEKYNIENITGMSRQDLSNVTEKLISYLKGNERDLNMEASINGEIREVFGQREKQHMIDVRDLFIKSHRLRNISLAISLITALIIILVSKRRKKDIWQSILFAGIVPNIFAMILYILVKIDFNKYFTYFHKIFFNNDLWLLNPKTDVLIQMLPLEFFIDISTRIIGWFLGILILMIVMASINLKKSYID